LRAVTKKAPPQLGFPDTPREAEWEQGRKDLFYRYGKTYLQTLGEQD
jgi:hypothetical protein